MSNSKMTISTRLARKINLGNYESKEAEVFISQQIDKEVGECPRLGFAKQDEILHEAIANALDGESFNPTHVKLIERYRNRIVRIEQIAVLDDGTTVPLIEETFEKETTEN